MIVSRLWTTNIPLVRWVTSGDWSQDDEEMTITIP